LTNVTLGDSATSVGDWAFAFCSSLSTINCRGNAPILDGINVFYGDPATVYYLPGAIGWGTSLGGLSTVLWNPVVPYNYITNNGTITITGYNGPSPCIIIPNAINFLPVTTLRGWTFDYWANMTGVAIPASVTNIQNGTFEFFAGPGGGPFHGDLLSITVDTNNLVYSSVDGVLFDKSQTTLIDYPEGRAGSYTIPDGVSSVAENAFYYCSYLTNVTIPASVTNIGTAELPEYNLASLGNNAFSSCAGLTAINVDTNNPAYSSVNGVLFDKSGTTLIDYPPGIYGNYIIPKSVSTIEGNAFELCNYLLGVTVPSSVTNIGDNAFFQCSRLAYLNFLGNAPSLGGANVFSQDTGTVYYSTATTGWGTTLDGLAAVLWDAPVPFLYTTNNGAITITGYTGVGGDVSIPDTINGLPVTAIGNNAFANLTSINSIAIGTNITSVGSDTFIFCSGMTNVIIGSGVTTIGNYAFDGCSALSNANIPDSVGSMGVEIFLGCTNLTNVTIGSGVAYLGENLNQFADCSRLTAITVSTNNPAFCSVNGVVFNKSQTTLVAVPPGICGSYTIPTTVTIIGYYAFTTCSGLTSVTIPASVTNIWPLAFSFCSSLTNATIPASVTLIEPGLFLECPRLTMEVDPNNSFYTTVDGVLFYKNPKILVAYPCSRTGSYTVPDGVASIGSYSFYGSALGSVTMPNSVAFVGQYAFAYCPILTNITISAGVTYLLPNSVTYCYDLTAIHFLGNAPTVSAATFNNDPVTLYYLPGTVGWDDFANNVFIARIPWLLPYPQILTSANGSASFGPQGGQFGFTVSWATNTSLVVEAATNLTNPLWVPVQTNTLNNGSFYFSDPQWTNYPARFYRIATP
jgi:hypothetical protein